MRRARARAEGRMAVLRMWLNAALAAALVRRGYRFIALDEALQDKAYRLPDTFVGAPSNSWFNHWEITAGRDPIPTPRPAEWVGR